MTEYWRLSASEIAKLVRGGEASAVGVAQDALARMAAVNPALNAVVAEDAAQTLAQAEAVDRRIAAGEDPGPLAGVPVTIKVNTDQAGFATTNGLRIQRDLIAASNNPVVDNLLKAGAVVLGRTNTPAFSLRWFTDNALHGATKNPWDPSRTPGGSSGGAAAAVASGIGALAHGTDIGGSVRYPAYACGVHGLRPTLGRVAAYNASGPERGIGPQLMAVSGPLARSIADLRLGLQAMSMPDARDPWWVPAPLEGPPAPKRAALTVAPEGMVVAPEVATALRAAATRLQDAGWTVVETPCPPLREPALMQLAMWHADMRRGGLAAIAREDEPAANFAVARMQERLALHPDLPDVEGVLQRRLGLLREWLLFLERYPVLLLPVSGELPFPDGLDVSSKEGSERVIAAQLTQVGLPLLGLPGLSVSMGTVPAEGRQVPVGVQLVAGRYREDLCLAAGAVIEAGGAPIEPIDPRP